MGNLCGKESADKNFSSPGRPLNSNPATNTTPKTSSIPANLTTKRIISEPPRKLGGGSDTDNTNTTTKPSDDVEARRKAADAAEARAQASKAKAGSGKLGAQLLAQKGKSRSEVLGEGSREERAMREADLNAEIRAHN